MPLNPYLHHEYLQSVIPDSFSRCRRCGGGPVMYSVTMSDHCLNCRSYVVSEPMFRWSDVVTGIKRLFKKFISVFCGMPKTKVDPFFRLTEGLDL
ncbi:MAG: hypothetical protein FJ146_15650 [Deltaproteobacteria bacterium]|nr:hypothetical protein [Deltaproteobacteria bacterium]